MAATVAVGVVLGGTPAVRAGTISLADIAVNLDGAVSSAKATGAGFDSATGIGTLQFVFNGLGTHRGLLFVDHEISEAVNGFDNELGSAIGALPALVSWEIDEPGFANNPGDIYDHFQGAALDNQVGRLGPDDVSMALGWTFDLGARETGLLTFVLGTQVPRNPFYLKHLDPDSGEAIYLSGDLTIRPSSLADGGDALVPWLALSAFVGVAHRWTRRTSGPA